MAATEEDAVLVELRFDQWREALSRIPSLADRIQRQNEILDREESRLRSRLSGLNVRLERLTALNSWTVRGPRLQIEVVRQPQGPLSGSEFSVVADDTFFEAS